MQLFITAFLLDETPNGVVTAIRLTYFTPTSVEDRTLFLDPAEQLTGGRSISSLAICELAYADLMTAQRVLPVDPAQFLSVAEVSKIVSVGLALASHVFLADGMTAEALQHMLPTLHHVVFPPIHYRPELDFFSPLTEF